MFDHLLEHLTEFRKTAYLRVCVLVSQSYPTLRDPVNCSLPGSSVRGILQARIVEWVAISFSRGSSLVSCITGRFFTV